MKRIRIFKFKEWLKALLTREVIQQERSLRWKLSHYSTKILVILLVSQITFPYLFSNLALAGEKIEQGKVLGASVTKITNKVAKPLYGHFKMESKEELTSSFESTIKLTNSFIQEIDKSIDKIVRERKTLVKEIDKTKKEIEVMQTNLNELVSALSQEMEVSFFEQLLSDDNFSKVDIRMSENELVFKHFNAVLEALKRKQQELEILLDKVGQEEYVLAERRKEKDEQKRQLLALNQGKSFFSEMENQQFNDFLIKEKELLKDFEKEKKEDPVINISVAEKVLTTQIKHFEDLKESEEAKIQELESEVKELDQVTSEVLNDEDESKIEDLLNILISLENDNELTHLSSPFYSKLVTKAYALSPQALGIIKSKLQKSTKLNLIEKSKILTVKNESELKKQLIQIVTRIKKEKDVLKNQSKNNSAYASKITEEISESLKVFDKIVPGKSMFPKHPLTENPVLISAEYGSKAYEKAVGMFHNGVDMAIPQGTPIFAVSDGVVKSAIFNETPSLAYLIVIHNKENRMSAYLHLSKILVKDLDIIKKGQLLAYSGGTPGTFGAGLSTGPHLHFEIRQMDNIRINPYPSEIPGSPPVLKFVGF